jgi:hypothetical protein
VVITGAESSIDDVVPEVLFIDNGDGLWKDSIDGASSLPRIDDVVPEVLFIDNGDGLWKDSIDGASSLPRIDEEVAVAMVFFTLANTIE